MEGDAIKDIGFQGSGCAISRASASMMTQIVKGKSKEEAARLFEEFHHLVTGKEDALAKARRNWASWQCSAAFQNFPRA